MQALLKRHPITSYFLLSFLLAWAVWIPVGLFVPNVVTAHILPGAWAPTIAALVLTAVLDGRAGVRRLLRGVLKWRVAWYWYVFAILGPTLVVFAAILVHLLLGGTAPTLAGIAARFGLPAERAMLVLAFLPLVYVTSIFAGVPLPKNLAGGGTPSRVSRRTSARPSPGSPSGCYGVSGISRCSSSCLRQRAMSRSLGFCR
jgi:hypothetical protein